MTNFIKKIELFANNNIILEPLETITLITGFSGKGKTLLFKLIKYALGETKSVDIEEAKRQFPGLESICMTFSNEYVFCRKLNIKFDGSIKFDKDGDFIAQDEKAYKQHVGELFGHENIKVIKKGNPPTAVSFTISEYLNTLFFDETKLTDDKTLIEAEGYPGRLKLRNYYKYFLTGEIIDQHLIEEANVEQKKATIIGKAFSYLSKSVHKPSKEIKKEKINIQNKIKNNEIKLAELESNIQNLETTEKSLSINKNKLISLYDLYYSQLTEIEAASVLDDFMKKALIICPHCGEKIEWEYISDPEEQMKKLSAQVTDIIKTISNIEKTLENNKIKRQKNLEEIRELEKENYKLCEQMTQIDKKINDYLAIENCKNVALPKQPNKSYVKQLTDRQQILDNEFNTQITNLSQNVSNRLIKWGFEYKVNVGFDFDKFDFRFDGTIRTLLPKGYRAFYTIAVIIELMLHMKDIAVPCFDFVLVDTIWKVASFEKENLNAVASNFMSDIAGCGLQIIIFENDDIKIENDNYKHIIL